MAVAPDCFVVGQADCGGAELQRVAGMPQRTEAHCQWTFLQCVSLI